MSSDQRSDEAVQDRAATLRGAMVEDLRRTGELVSDSVAAAFRAVPRDLFAPGDPVERAYDIHATVGAKRDASGAATSVTSAAVLQAVMLEQAAVSPGMRVLEIGSGGYQAALLAELVGGDGVVTSVDIDPDIVDRARLALAKAGYGRVAVVETDAENGVAEYAPYDRIIVTAGAADVPPAWLDQLAPDGLIVMPLRLRGLTRTIAFTRHENRLVGRHPRLCSFVPMQGIGARHEVRVPIGEDAVVRTDGDGPADAVGLRAALRGPRAERWSGVVFDHVDRLDFWLGMQIEELGVLQAAPEAIESGLFAASARLPVPTMLGAGGTFAYRTKRAIPGTEEFEVGVFAHGPDADALSRQYVELIRTWDTRHRHGPGPLVEVHPAGTPDADLPAGARVLDNRHTRIAVSWP